jgi:hypothetical protein
MMLNIAPVVKWISQLTSDQLFWVRVLAGAHIIKTPKWGFYYMCTSDRALRLYRTSLENRTDAAGKRGGVENT